MSNKRGLPLDDGFRVRKNGGDWSFVEGVSKPVRILNNKEAQALEACCKRRGIKRTIGGNLRSTTVGGVRFV